LENFHFRVSRKRKETKNVFPTLPGRKKSEKLLFFTPAGNEGNEKAKNRLKKHY